MSGTDVETFDVDGVPTLFVRTSGPTRAVLMFRVGQADETLAERGVTHLLEHLALFGLDLADLHANGATDQTMTCFPIHGSESDVIDFLREVCTGLTDPPLHRLAVEKDILRVEDGGRARSAAHDLAVWRYGARSYGLAAFPELGLPGLDAEALNRWSRRWFTRGNAVLAVVGERMPVGLRLPLLDGPRMPAPEPSNALARTPAWFHGAPDGIAFDLLVPRTSAAPVFGEALRRALFRTLRQEHGHSYAATAGYSPRDADVATVIGCADMLPGRDRPVTAAVLQVLDKLAHWPDRHDDLDAIRAMRLDEWDRPEKAEAMVVAHGMNLLWGHPTLTLAQMREEIRALTGADIRACARAGMRTILLSVPPEAEVGRVDFTYLHAGSSQTVSGRRYRAWDDRHTELVIGTDGVMLTSALGVATVLFDGCAAKLDWPDGARTLVGADGITVVIEPTLFRLRREDLARLDEVLAHVAAPCLERSAEHIPRPRSARARVLESLRGR